MSAKEYFTLGNTLREHLQRECKCSKKGSDAWDVKNGTDLMCALWERNRGGDTCMISVEPQLSL